MPIHNNAFVPQKVIQIGAGGTGSRLCSEMCFFFRGNYSQLGTATYTLVDHDRVSQSNFNRQLYFPHEGTSQTKGQILVNRYRDLFPIFQIPEPVNSDTIHRIFPEALLNQKLLVILSADNSLVVKQVLEHLMNNAQNDWYWIFTGANLIETEIAGLTVKTGSGQAYAYGKVNGIPLYPIPPTETLVDIMEATGFGPTSTGQGCGVTENSGAQTPLMNDSCCSYTMQLINLFFEHGIFIPSVYFTDGVEVTYGDAIDVSSLFERLEPTVDTEQIPEVQLDQTDVLPSPLTNVEQPQEVIEAVPF